MHFLRDTTLVSWFAPDRNVEIPSELCDWQIEVTDDLDQLNADSDLIVLDVGSFEDPKSIRRLCMAMPCPVLCMTCPEKISETVGWLLAKDDVCLSSSPPSLIAARLSKLRFSQLYQLDPMTGVQRREALFAFLQNWSISSSDEPLALILADIDDFKSLNERLGRDQGDQVLQRLGALLREECTHFPLLARMSGQEFAIVHSASEQLAHAFAENLRLTIANQSLCQEADVQLSFGVASLEDAKGAAKLYDIADEALFAAKGQGRNRVVSYSDLKNDSMLKGEDPDLISLEYKSRVLGERVANFVNWRSRSILKNLREEAETDGLTKFYTRRFLDRRLECQFRGAKMKHHLLSVALIDLDHFGLINKKHGWPTGDKVLTSLSEKIRQNLRRSDWVGRYGGEEFCLVMLGTSIEEAEIACERLRHTVEADTFETTHGDPLKITLSIGIVQCDETDVDPQQLIERVSLQTLAAKNGGRNRVCADHHQVPSSLPQIMPSHA